MSLVSLHTALSGILAGRAGMDTAAHNVANANTPGYTRQRTEVSARQPYAAPVGNIGSGVQVDDIVRVRDDFLDARVRATESALAGLSARAELLSRAEGVMNEPEAGVAAELGELWAAFEELALEPADGAARQQVLAALDAVTSRIRTVAEDWQLLAQDTVTDLRIGVDEVNQLTRQLADLNREILDAGSTAGTPNDLMDRRDQLVDELAGRIGARATEQPDGTVRLSLDGLALVSGTRVQLLAVDPLTHALQHPAGPSPAAGGEIAAVQRFLTTDLPALQDELDAFTATLAETLNTTHAAGYTPAGAAGGPLVDWSGSALTVRRAVATPDQLAAAGTPVAQPDGTFRPAPHDGTNAAALAGLRSSAGLDDHYRELVTELGATVASAGRGAESQAQLAAAARSARAGVHGVSLDEEMVSMLTYQRGLEAASRMLTAADEALDVLINRTGLVGR